MVHEVCTLVQCVCSCMPGVRTESPVDIESTKVDCNTVEAGTACGVSNTRDMHVPQAASYEAAHLALA